MLDLENAEETEIKLKTSVGSQKNQGNTRKALTKNMMENSHGVTTDFKMDLVKAEESEIKLPTSVGSLKKQELQKNICFIDYTKALLCGSQPTVENSSRDGNTRPPDLPHEKSVCRKRGKVRTRHGAMTWFQMGKE